MEGPFDLFGTRYRFGEVVGERVVIVFPASSSRIVRSFGNASAKHDPKVLVGDRLLSVAIELVSGPPLR